MAHIQLGEIATFRNGLNFTKDSHGNGCKIIGVPSFSDRLIPDYDTLSEIDPKGIVKNDDKLKFGDIVFVRSNGNKNLVGRSLFINRNCGDLVFSGFCIRARFNSGVEIDPKFYAYYFRTELFRKSISSASGGANIQNLNQGILNRSKVPNPPLFIQRKISSILSAYDDLIENNFKRIKLLEETAQITFNEWFGKIGDLPQGWRRKKLTEIAEFLNGYAFKPSDLKKEGLPVIKIKELKGGIQNDTPRNSGKNIPPKYLVATGDILFSWSASLEVVQWQHEKGILNQHLFKVTPKKGVSKALLFLSLKNALPIFNNLTTGATMKHIKRKELDFVQVVIPTQKVMNEFDRMILPVLELSLNINHQNRLLKEERDILLPRLMTGMIKVEPTETKIISIAQPKQKEATWEFKEAVLISLLSEKFGSEKFPLGRKRYTKLSYLFHRHADNQTQNYLRKAAGPYNPKTKYAGPEKIAHQNGYVADHKNGNLTGFIAGKNISAAKTYFENYWSIDSLNWLETNFRYKSNDQLELYATVDHAMLELHEKKRIVNVDAVKQIIKTEKEWKAKLEREIFNDANIQKAITHLPTLFQNS